MHANMTVADTLRIVSRPLVEESMRDLNVVEPFTAVSPSQSQAGFISRKLK
jgi:hypothetical protein